MKLILQTKWIVFTTYCLLCPGYTFAQWSNDPANPQVVCSEDNTRLNVQSHPDGNGGVYVFWLDKRTSSNHGDVFGQHYNSDGEAQWENDGREILDYSASISKYTTYRNESNGDLFIASYTNGSLPADSLRLRKINMDGSAMWTEDLAIGQTDGCSPPNYILTLHNLQITASNDNYALVYQTTLCGGYTQLYLSAFTSDGDLLTPYYGVAIGGGGDWSLQPTFDDSGDIFVSATYFDNGTEALLLRIDMNGEESFTAVNMSSGPSSLNYMYRILSDENGITFLWVSEDSNIYARRFDNTGNQLWDDATLNICAAEGAQDAFYMLLNDDEISVVWRDARPGVLGGNAIYAQRFTLAGDVLWTADGIEVADINTSTPFPKFVINDEGDMIVCHTSNIVGMTAHKVLNDGSVQWGPNGLVQCNTPFNQGAADYQVIKSGDNVIMTWQKSILENEILISRVYPQATETYQDVIACESYTFNGVTYDDSGIYLVELPGDTLLTLDLIVINVEATVTLDGATLTDTYVEGNSTWWNCDTNTNMAMGSDTFTPTTSGNYALIVEQGGCVDTSDCYLINVIGVEEWHKDFSISLFPNPTSGSLNLRSEFPLKNVDVLLYDAQGKLIYALYNHTFERMILELQSFTHGLHNLVIRDDNRYYSSTFIKD